MELKYSKEFKKVSKAPIQKLSLSLDNFIKANTSSGIIVIIAVILSLILANSIFSNEYFAIIHTPFIIGLKNPLGLGDILIEDTILHWINDGLMSVFFFLIGLEIKREILIGELNSLKHAFFPFIGACGGMLFPAIIYIFFNPLGTIGFPGWAITTATDIAFSLVILSLIGSKISIKLKFFLTTLAIFDDIGAIMIIAFFYTPLLDFNYLYLAILMLTILIIINKLGFRNNYIYLVFGIFLWYFLFQSGIHATLAGVLLAFTIPATTRIDMDEFKISGTELLARIYTPGPDEKTLKAINIQLGAIESLKRSCYDIETPLIRLENSLSPYVAFIIVPIFALVNSAILIPANIINLISNPITLGCFFGLLLGKPIGIFTSVYLSKKINIIKIPYGIKNSDILGIGFIAGIGFTMSFLIANLALATDDVINPAKIGILLGSFISAIIGYLILWYPRKDKRLKKN